MLFIFLMLSIDNLILAFSYFANNRIFIIRKVMAQKKQSMHFVLHMNSWRTIKLGLKFIAITTSINDTCNWNSDWFLNAWILLNSVCITWGINPVWKPSLKSIPIVYVFPDPVFNATICKIQKYWFKITLQMSIFKWITHLHLN